MASINNLSPPKKKKKERIKVSCLERACTTFNPLSVLSGLLTLQATCYGHTSEFLPVHCSTVNTMLAEVAYLSEKKKKRRKELHSIYCSTLEHKKKSSTNVLHRMTDTQQLIFMYYMPLRKQGLSLPSAQQSLNIHDRSFRTLLHKPGDGAEEPGRNPTWDKQGTSLAAGKLGGRRWPVASNK